MIDVSAQIARKMLLKVINNPLNKSSLDVYDIVLGLLYESLQSTYTISPDWSAFQRGGQFESPDGMNKAQIAVFQPGEDQPDAALWAMRVRARDPISKRRSWVIQIGIRKTSSDTLELYYISSFYDHMAGYFGSFKSPEIQEDRFMQPIFACGQILCVSGEHTLPGSAVELRHTTLPEMLEIVLDTKRSIPLIFISCPDLINPDVLFGLMRGNVFVYWCMDASVVARLNELIPQDTYVEWDSVQVFLPLDDNPHQRHPFFLADAIAQTGGNEIMIGLYQAYCQGLRSEERRAFVSIEDIRKLLDVRYLSNLNERIKALEETTRKLTTQLAQREKDNQSLKASLDALAVKKDAVDTAEFDALLTEALTETDALKTGISELAATLYSDLGKSFKADCVVSSPHLQELAHAIYASLARASDRKGS